MPVGKNSNKIKILNMQMIIKKQTNKRKLTSWKFQDVPASQIFVDKVPAIGPHLQYRLSEKK